MNRTPKNSKRDELADFVMTVAGIVLAMTPLALWASPSKEIFYLTLIVCGVAYGVILLVARVPSSKAGAQFPSSKDPARVTLPANLIDELQNQREASRASLPILKNFVQESTDPSGKTGK